MGPCYKVGSANAGFSREFFSDDSVLTSEVRKRGVGVLPAVETLCRGVAPRADYGLTRDWVVRREIDRARRGWYRCGFFAPPLHTFSSIWNFNLVRTRTSENPWGVGTNLSEVRGNATLDATIRIAKTIKSNRGDVIIETPRSHLLYLLPEWNAFTLELGLKSFHVDLGAFGFGPPHTLDRCRKSVQLWSTLNLPSVERWCDGTHGHIPLSGRVPVDHLRVPAVAQSQRVPLEPAKKLALIIGDVCPSQGWSAPQPPQLTEN